jgi:hypothetical protein
VLVHRVVGGYAQTFIDFPPMQKIASLNFDQLKEEIQKKMATQSAVPRFIPRLVPQPF